MVKSKSGLLQFSKEAVFSNIETGLIWKAENYNPQDYGFPLIQNDDDLARFISDKLVLYKRRGHNEIVVHRKMREFIADVFFGREKQVLLWKSRGSSGSLSVALILFLRMVYFCDDALDIAGSAGQAKNVFDYIYDWSTITFPRLAGLFDGYPTKSTVRLITGAEIICTATSEKAARGPHKKILAIDEACVLPGTWIVTKDGLKKIEEIRSGDSVLTHTGKFQTVIRVMEKQKVNSECVKIKVFGMPEFSLTSDHQVLTSDENWIPCGSLQPGDRCGFLLPQIDSIESSKQLPLWMSGETGYRWAGRFIGDGHTGIYDVILTAGNTDSHTIDYIESVHTLFNRTATITDRRKGSHSIRFSPGRDVIWKIRELFGTKASEKRIPREMIINGTDDELINLLVGLIETDGCVSISRSTTGGNCNRIFFCTISDRLAVDFYILCLKLGICPSLKRRNSRTSIIRGKTVTSKDNWEFAISGAGFRALIPYFDPAWVDDRKHQLGEIMLVDSHRVSSQIKSVGLFNYTGTVYDLEVEDDHSFNTLYMSLHNCQKDPAVAPVLEAALSQTGTEGESIIIIDSTLHHEDKFFAPMWDFSDQRGFKRYSWDEYDAMQRCTRRVDCKRCALTEKEEVYGDDYNVVGVKYSGCNGKARHSDGFMSFDQVLGMKNKLGAGDAWRIEHECQRPTAGAGRVFDDDTIFAMETEEPMVLIDQDREFRFLMGIDWGHSAATAMVLGAYPCNFAAVEKSASQTNFLGLFDSWYFRRRSMDQIIALIRKIIIDYRIDDISKLIVLADASHPFNNHAISDQGIHVIPIEFKKWKQAGIYNLQQYQQHRLIKILSNYEKRRGCWELVYYLRRYIRNEDGTYNKDDHFPDAFTCFGLGAVFEELYADYLEDKVRMECEDDVLVKQNVPDFIDIQSSSKPRIQGGMIRL